MVDSVDTKGWFWGNDMIISFKWLFTDENISMNVIFHLGPIVPHTAPEKCKKKKKGFQIPTCRFLGSSVTVASWWQAGLMLALNVLLMRQLGVFAALASTSPPSLPPCLPPLWWKHPDRPRGSAAALLTPLQMLLFFFFFFFFLGGCSVLGLTITHPFPEPRLHTSEGRSHLIYARLPALLFQLLFLDVISIVRLLSAAAHILIDCSAYHGGVAWSRWVELWKYAVCGLWMEFSHRQQSISVRSWVRYSILKVFSCDSLKLIFPKWV